MNSTGIGAYAAAFVAEHTATFMQALSTAASAAEQGRLREAALAGQRLSDGGRHLVKAVVRDALAADMWWALGDMLSMHPQAAWEQFAKRGTCPGPTAPAPGGDAHRGPGGDARAVARLRCRPRRRGAGIQHHVRPCRRATAPGGPSARRAVWIFVALPGSGADSTPLAGADVIRQWTSVLADENALTWLREVVTTQSAGPCGDDGPAG
ncbi:hypothetical protein GCM10009662_43510 [Catellatospora coxensis]|uniref:Uncharacterized protein n=1 Tax=Catellatospora coxensis TaxID=310354 RepID=A0A8J3L315_9ACTN|nr:hypothetical protein Cco03nite_24150 [Catellatospora coxensis]